MSEKPSGVSETLPQLARSRRECPKRSRCQNEAVGSVRRSTENKKSVLVALNSE